MNEKYLKALTSFEDDELTYKFITDYQDNEKDVKIKKDFLYGKGMRIVKHDWRTKAVYHSLEVLKIAYIHSGTFVIYIDGKPTKLTAGNMCIVPPNIVHKFTIDYTAADVTDTVMINILINPALVTKILGTVISSKNEVSDYINNALYGQNYPQFAILSSPSETTKDIARVFLEECLSTEDTGESDITAQCMFNALLFSYIRSPEHIIKYSDNTTVNENSANQIIRKIQTDFQTITLNELCESFHYTPSYICRLIKKQTGRTFKEFLTEERMKYACEELIATEKNVNVIATEAGWKTIEHFYRIFNKMFGMTPLEYRKNHKNINN